MSPITKLFVVLHVVLSMLLTAGVVVFVNRVDEYQKIVVDQKAKIAAADNAAAIASNAESAAKQALASANEQLDKQIQAAKGDRDKAVADIANLEVKLADADKRLAIAMADNSRLTAGMAASQSAQTQYFAMVTDLRGSVDKLTKEKLELDTTIADLTNQRDVLEKQRRDLAERVTLIETDLKVATDTLTANNLKPSKFDAPRVPPPINGVVREVRLIEQIPYATISVGSADAVTQNMEFKVIDRNRGDFLGVLRVESVEANEATGRLFGPGVDRVRPGVEVRTQL